MSDKVKVLSFDDFCIKHSLPINDDTKQKYKDYVSQVNTANQQPNLDEMRKNGTLPDSIFD